MKPGINDDPEVKMPHVKGKIKETVGKTIGNSNLKVEENLEKFQGREQSTVPFFFETTHTEATENQRNFSMPREEGKITTQIKVELFEGIVQLSGFVDSQMASNRAVGIALSIAGVKSVENDLFVGNKTEDAVGKAVKKPDLVAEGKVEKLKEQMQTGFPSFFDTSLTEAIESKLLYPRYIKEREA